MMWLPQSALAGSYREDRMLKASVSVCNVGETNLKIVFGDQIIPCRSVVIHLIPYY